VGGSLLVPGEDEFQRFRVDEGVKNGHRRPAREAKDVLNAMPLQRLYDEISSSHVYPFSLLSSTFQAAESLFGVKMSSMKYKNLFRGQLYVINGMIAIDFRIKQAACEQ
jgi:hypothetical protein